MSPRQRRVRAGRVGTSDEAGFRGTGTTLPYDKSEYSGSHSHRLHPRDSESAPCPLQVNYKKIPIRSSLLSRYVEISSEVKYIGLCSVF